MIKVIPALLFISSLTFNLAYAEDLGFESTSEGILERLASPPKKTFKRRGLGGLKTSVKKRKITVAVPGAQEKLTRAVTKTVTIVEDPPPTGVNLKIEFATNSARLKQESIPVLKELGKALTNPALKGKKVFLKGHSDADGEDRYNMELSLKRAKVVREYLVNNFSIPMADLEALGYGETMPIKPNNSAINKQYNRRVEVSLAE